MGIKNAKCDADFEYFAHVHQFGYNLLVNFYEIFFNLFEICLKFCVF
jgi:hypothetical protein